MPHDTGNCSPHRCLGIWLLRGFNALLLFLEAIYHVDAERVSVTAQRSVFYDTIYRILEHFLLMTHPRIFLLRASIAIAVRFDTVWDCCTKHFCWEASLYSLRNSSRNSKDVARQCKHADNLYTGYRLYLLPNSDRCFVCFSLHGND